MSTCWLFLCTLRLQPANDTFRAGKKNWGMKKKVFCQGATAATDAANGIMAGFELAGVFLFYSLGLFIYLFISIRADRNVNMHCLKNRDGKIITVILNVKPCMSEHPDKQREANATRTL